MLLQRLREYADRLELPPRLYVEAPVRYIIELDASGNLLARQPTEETARRPVPQINRSSGIRPLPFADNAEYNLGLARPNSDPARVAACHAAYLELIRRCAKTTGEPAVRAVEAFLQRQPKVAELLGSGALLKAIELVDEMLLENQIGVKTSQLAVLRKARRRLFDRRQMRAGR